MTRCSATGPAGATNEHGGGRAVAAAVAVQQAAAGVPAWGCARARGRGGCTAHTHSNCTAALARAAHGGTAVRWQARAHQAPPFGWCGGTPHFLHLLPLPLQRRCALPAADRPTPCGCACATAAAPPPPPAAACHRCIHGVASARQRAAWARRSAVRLAFSVLAVTKLALQQPPSWHSRPMNLSVRRIASFVVPHLNGAARQVPPLRVWAVAADAVWPRVHCSSWCVQAAARGQPDQRRQRRVRADGSRQTATSSRLRTRVA